MNRLAFSLLLLCGLVLSACNNREGEGGRTTLVGQVYYKLQDTNGNFLGREEARNEDVFITYGDNERFDDDTHTHHDGQYQFPFLFKGKYTVYGYSDCPNCDSGIEPVSITVDLSGKREDFVAPDLELTRVLAPDDGTATLTGRVFVREYNTTGELVSEYYGADREVFIMFEDGQAPFERVLTSGEGYFEFPNLIPGNFVLYSFSECNNCPGSITPSEVDVTVSAKGQQLSTEDIIVEER